MRNVEFNASGKPSLENEYLGVGLAENMAGKVWIHCKKMQRPRYPLPNTFLKKKGSVATSGAVSKSLSQEEKNFV